MNYTENISMNKSLHESVKSLDSDSIDIYLEAMLGNNIDDVSMEREHLHIPQVIQDITDILAKSNIDKRDITDIYLENNTIKLRTDNDILYFHLSNRYKLTYIGNKEKISENKSAIIQNLGAFENLLNAIDYLFDQNGEGAFDFGYLDEKDILDNAGARRFGVELKGKTIQELQEMAREYSKSIHRERIHVPERDIALDIKIQEQQKRYLSFVVGIGDRLEGGAKLFTKSKEEISELVQFTVDSYGSDHEGLLRYLSETHEAIDKNNYQSTSVEASYKTFASNLHSSIFTKFKRKQEHTSDDTFMSFVKIVTGRIGNIDNRLKEMPSFTNQVVLHIFQREGGTLDKINESGELEIEDKEVGDTPPNSIVSNTMEKLDNIPGGSKLLLQDIGFSKILQIPEGSNYQELRLEEKIMISTLARVLEKLGDTPVTARAEVSDLFMQVAEEANKTVVESLNEHFDDDWKPGLTPWGTVMEGKDAEDFGLSEIQTEIFNLYNDINGNGLFDLSDKTWKGVEAGVKFAAVITAGIVAGFALPAVLAFAGVASVSAVGIGAAVGLTSALASITVNPKGYDSLNEMLIDIGTDLPVAAATGAIGGGVIGGFTKQFSHSSRLGTVVGDQSVGIMSKIGNGGKTFFPHDKGIGRLILNGYSTEGAKFLSREGAKNTGIFLGDLLALGLIVEGVRQKGVNGIFHSESIFEKEKSSIEEVQEMETQEIKKEERTYKVFHEGEFFQEVKTEGAPLASALTDEDEIQETKESFIDTDMLPLINFKEKLASKPFNFAALKADTEAVKSLQLFLSKNSGNALEVDGMFGQITYEAVKEFQGSHNDIDGNPLQIDGVPGEKTLGAMIQNSGHNNINS